MRKDHYWRKAKSAPSPSEMVVVDTESWHGEQTRVEGGELHRLRLGCALAYRYEKGKRTRVQELDFYRADAFWGLVEKRLNDRRTVWIVGHNLAYDLGILCGWRWLNGKNVAVDKHIIDGGIFYLTGSCNGKPWAMIDTFNWYKCSLEMIAAANGLPKLTMPEQSDDDYKWFEYCRRDVNATAAGVDSLVRYVKENDYGPFQPTIASLAFSVYRHRFMTEKTLVHNCKDALTLERNAYYGGMVETPLIGREVSGPVHECDVVSMYPNVCTQDLPTVFRGLLRRPSRRDVEVRLKGYACIADVGVNCRKSTYPFRSGRNVYHCTGRFRTQIADAELRRAMDAGEVDAVHTICWYRKAPIFAQFMRHFARHKCINRYFGWTADELLDKFLMNSLYGKTGQMTPRWLPWNEYSLAIAEEVSGLPPGSLSWRAGKPPVMDAPEKSVIFEEYDLSLPVRQYWGDVEVAVGRTESRDSVPSIAACVTSSARVQLQSYHAIAGPGNWYYSDTDSVWVSDNGLSLLRSAGKIGTGTLGTLEVKRTVDSLIVHGRKDYVYSGGRKTKGRRKTAVDLSATTFCQLHFPSAKVQLAKGPWNGVFVAEAIKTLRRNVDWCHLGTDGRTSHFHLPADRPLMKS